MLTNNSAHMMNMLFDNAEQVDQIHSKHRNKLDNLRGSNKAKANDILLRLQSSKQKDREEQDEKPN
jgi:hypothetical protein